jgi:hypothetical protein
MQKSRSEIQDGKKLIRYKHRGSAALFKIEVGLIPTIRYPFGAGAFRGEMMVVVYICNDTFW